MRPRRSLYFNRSVPIRKILGFDIETVPDLDAGRRLHQLDGVSDEDVLRAMRHLQYQKSGTEFLPLHLHRVVAISCVYEDDGSDNLPRTASLGEIDTSEHDLVAKFFDIIEQHKPRLVSWNGNGFDLPVLNYRALLYGIVAKTYWDTGEFSREARFMNYQNRFHPQQNLDLMAHLSRYQRGAGLDDLSRMLGFPGKSGMHGDEVAGAWMEGRLDEIRNYCDTDAANTYLLYLRYELIAGAINRSQYDARYARMAEALKASEQAHLVTFGEQMDADAAGNSVE